MRKARSIAAPRAVLLLLGLALAGAAGPHARAQDRYRGAGIALAWCRPCHVIDAQGTGPAFTEVPSFPAIARKPDATPDYLRQWLSAEHVRMPKLSLTDRDKEDLISYIRSLDGDGI